MRNQLLNFRPGARSIQIVDEISTEVYDLLVIQDEKMQFLQKPDEEEENLDQISNDEHHDLTHEEADILWELPPPDVNVAERYIDLFLQTGLNSKELQKRLRYIDQQAKSVFDEQGYNILYIALGLIEWKESPDAHVMRKAPLILIPVELSRNKVSKPFNLKWTGDDILTNISIQSKLVEQGIEIPNFEMPEEKEGIYEYFEAVKNAVSHMENWTVINDIYLSFFSFTKFVMFQDLDPVNWPQDLSFEQNSIIQGLFDPKEESGDSLEFSEEDVDKKLESKDIYTVLDADSSQIAVIENVKNQKNLVVEGPPGTGKSQTIVNLIAELMISGKTVLFVSEKIAALEVVKNRLDFLGLGEFCLELHSRKSNKKEVLAELERTLSVPSEIASIPEEKFEEMDRIKSELDLYSDTLHQSVGKIKLTPFQLFGMKEEALLHFNKKEIEMPHIIYDNIEVYSSDEFNNSILRLNDIFEILTYLEPLSENPWKYTKPETLFPSDQDEISRLLTESVEILQNIGGEIGVLSDISGVFVPKNRAELDDYMEISEMLLNSDNIKNEILENPEWNSSNSKADLIIKELEELKIKTNKFKTSILSQNIQLLLDDFKKYSNVLFKVPSNYFASYEDEIKLSLKNTSLFLENIKTDITFLIDLTGVKIPYNKEELDETITNSKFLTKMGIVESSILSNTQWDNFNPTAKQLINDLTEYKSKFELINSKYIENILDQEIKQILEDLKKLQGKRLKFLSGDYKKTKTHIESFYNSDISFDDEKIIVDLEQLVQCQEIRNKIKGSESTAKSYFGSLWNGEMSDVQLLTDFSVKMVNFRELLLQGRITHQSVELVSLGIVSEKIDKTIINLMDNKNKVNGLLNTLNEFLSLEGLISEFNFQDMRVEVNSYTQRIEEYFNYKNKISEFYITAPISDEIIMEDLEKLIQCQDIRDSLKSSQDDANSLFGDYWKNEETDPQVLIKFSRWIINFRELLIKGKLTPKAVEIVSLGLDSEKITSSNAKINEMYAKFINNLKTLEKYLKVDGMSIFDGDFAILTFEDISSQMLLLKTELPKLLIWSQFISLEKDQTPLTGPVIKFVEDDVIKPEDMIPCFKGNFADNLLKTVFMNNPVLSNFVGDLHENKIKKFNELDKELLHINRKRIASEIARRKPNIYRSSPNSELEILLGEFNRKRRHISLRKLISKAGGLIQTIKPCFMMSPLSIAQFIDPTNVENMMFDVIIFDEASQVKPEDALGALLRGRQLVVMGDTKQLPPTSFFDSMIDTPEDEDYDITTLIDMESILHLCKRSFNTKMLRWHYRSRHESLIAVSNHEFYDNHLLIYPSPAKDSDELGLKFVYLPEAVYDRGRDSGNILEAKAIVNAVMEHFKKYGDSKSLGVGTFNVKQRRLIEDFLEIERKKDSSLEEFFSETREEKFFIKNLETIQGDERDVILVSVGFGFDSNHKLSHNFGPINKDGGERRLNVLFTRAREKCIIFANFKYSDLKIGPDSSFGLRSLKTFLEYAETKQLENIVAPREDTDSPFEDSVYECLRDYGFEVHKQVGCAGFRIDLAVVDPDSQGKYLVGIECDGAMYHSSEVARDRDILRQQVLEGLGWNIYRIWSTDWFRNRNSSIERLIKAIKDAPKKNNIPKVPYVSEQKPNSVIEQIPIKSNKLNVEEKSLEMSIPEYKICTSINIDKTVDLQKQSKIELAKAINQIVEVESPIHISEVIKRIRSYWGLKKAGKIIQTVIEESARISEQNGQITLKDGFVYCTNQSEISVRKRTGEPSANIALISPEEIQKAVNMIIQTQYATPHDDLITQVSRLFGFKSTSKKTSTKIREVIDYDIAKENLVEMPNGMINIPK